MKAGHHYVEIPLTDVVFFIRPDHLIPMSKGGQCVEDVDFEHVETVAFVKTEAVYEYYHDEGYGKDYEDPAHMTEIRACRPENKSEIIRIAVIE